MVETRSITIQTQGHLDIVNITEPVAHEIGRSPIHNGIITIFGPGSTCALTTIEFEPGLRKDIKNFLEEMFPYGKNYEHHATWGDDNGSGHLQSALLKTSFTVPIVNHAMTLGTWQQIVFIECDTRPRTRKLILQLIGE